MRDPVPGPGTPRADRMDEARKFGFYLFCSVATFAFTIVTSTILIARRSIDFDLDIIIVGGVCAGIGAMIFAYFGAMRKLMIVISILRVWMVVFLALQSLVFVIATVVYLHYGVHNPSIEAADSAAAAGLSLIGLFFGVFGIVRGIRHRWFAHVLQPGYTR